MLIHIQRFEAWQVKQNQWWRTVIPLRIRVPEHTSCATSRFTDFSGFVLWDSYSMLVCTSTIVSGLQKFQLQGLVLWNLYVGSHKKKIDKLAHEWMLSWGRASYTRRKLWCLQHFRQDTVINPGDLINCLSDHTNVYQFNVKKNCGRRYISS